MATATEPTLFSAYKVSTCGNQNRWGYIHGLTKAEIDKLPFGKLSDSRGSYTWGYGINNGKRI